MILAISIAVLVIALDAIIQGFFIEKKGVWINHALSASIAILYCFSIAYFCINGTWKIAAATLVLLVVRWLLFSPCLVMQRNRYRAKEFQLPLNYISSKKKNNSFLDSFLLKLPNPFHQYIIKFGLLFIFILLYLIL